MKFTVLTENHEADGLENEHGLSLFLEYNGKSYLLDAGHTGVFARNAEKLSVDLKRVELAILSHAHYDHGGGFEAFFEKNTDAPVYAAASGQRMDWYSMREEGPKYIGIPQEILERYPERFIWTDGVRELVPGMWLIPHSTPGLEKIGEKTGMYKKVQEAAQDSAFVPDDFTHEQSLVLETNHGLVVFNSCSHGGVGNIVNEVRKVFPEKQILAYIGGFHLKAPGSQDGMNCTEAEVRELGCSLMKLGIQYIYTGHCTGARGYELLKEVMGYCLQELRTGVQAEIF
jgi:7,8-dihydropterin-6-yl-methyl-4-(beta-D-ribofuranosyl)aminobenzene 5'-phosphate synthase